MSFLAFSTNFKPATAQNIDTHLTGPYGKAIQVKRHFVLVHGGSHGAWCWYKLSALLRFSGHNMTALNLASNGINTLQVRDIGGSVLKCCDPLMKFMESSPPRHKVILVAHRFGGVACSIAMKRFPEKISTAVFATAFMSSPTLTYPAIIEEVDFICFFE